MITAVDGVLLGHWTDPVARTGCSVVLLPPASVTSGEIRGGAPGTREWALLDTSNTVSHVDAIVLTGGSAFGLAACDGVARWCEERGLGYPTPAGAVPIVVGLVLYDLAVGDASVRPGAREGYAACAAATSGAPGRGPIGAGAGATVAKCLGPQGVRPGGLGSALLHHGELVVSALMAVNAYGDVRVGDEPVPLGPLAELEPGENTTIGVVVTNAVLDKSGCLLAARSGHDGMARALDPAHTRVDGDGLVVAATGAVRASPDLVRHLAAHAVEAAIRDAVVSAQRS